MILVHAFITSRLDNGNALLYGILEYLLAKIQCVQNGQLSLLLGQRSKSTLGAYTSTREPALASNQAAHPV